jgi:curli biogenesis system outer membrane secretion channel CsgG
MRFAAAAVATLLALPAGAEDLQTVAERGAGEIAAALQRAPSVRRLAMPPFSEVGAAKGLGPAVEAIVTTRLRTAGGPDVADRTKLAAVLGEQKLDAMLGSGRTAPDAALLAGAGAQAVLAGRVADGGDHLVLQLKVLSAAGAVLAQFQGTAELPARGEAPRAAPATAPIDVAMRRLADGLATGFARMSGSARYRRLAVLTFAETGAEAQRRKLGQVVTAEVATNLRRDHGLLLVERSRLSEILGELKLQQMASPSSAEAGQIGKLAGADALVLGQVSEVGDRYLVNGRIVATQTGETLAAESASVAAPGMVALARDAVVLRSRSDALFRSLLLPGLGQFYNRQPVKGWLFLGAELAVLGTALAYQVSASRAYGDYKAVSRDSSASPSADASRLYDRARSRYQTRNILLWSAAGIWAVNAVDAWVSGVDGEQLLSGGTASIAVAPTGDGALAAVVLAF